MADSHRTGDEGDDSRSRLVVAALVRETPKRPIEWN